MRVATGTNRSAKLSSRMIPITTCCSVQEDYDEYAKELEESLRTVHLRAFYISKPKPL